MFCSARMLAECPGGSADHVGDQALGPDGLDLSVVDADGAGVPGVLVGAVITGQLADLLGRKRVLYCEYFLLILLWFSSAFAPSWQLYAALRFFVGALVGGERILFHGFPHP